MCLRKFTLVGLVMKVPEAKITNLEAERVREAGPSSRAKSVPLPRNPQTQRQALVDAKETLMSHRERTQLTDLL